MSCEHDLSYTDVVGVRCSLCGRSGNTILSSLQRDLSAAQERWRPEVVAFADAMERELRANDHKGDWKNCDVLRLLGRLHEESVELKRAIVGEKGRKPVLSEAADVANFAMMIADVCGTLSASPAPTPTCPACRVSAMGTCAEPAPAPSAEPTCQACKDTHSVWSHALERNVMCTVCPRPCERCRAGAYCSATPCRCDCHQKPDTAPIAEPVTMAVAEMRLSPASAMKLAERHGCVSILNEDGSLHSQLSIPRDDRPLVDAPPAEELTPLEWATVLAVLERAKRLDKVWGDDLERSTLEKIRALAEKARR